VREPLILIFSIFSGLAVLIFPKNSREEQEPGLLSPTCAPGYAASGILNMLILTLRQL
jgi:hypothetical protein